MNERPLTDVPRTVLFTLLIAFSLQLAGKALQPPPRAQASDLDSTPSRIVLQLAGFGDTVPVAKLLMLHLQAFDLQGANQIAYRQLDYDRLSDWLERILELDPTGQYPLHAASRIYAEVQDQNRQRKMLDFVYNSFFADPDRRWRWLAHAAVIAKHQLKDLPLARRYAAAIQQHARGKDVPLWARQMEAFILEDMDELESAKIMIGGFIASGQVSEAGELRFLEDRLKEIELRLQTQKKKR